jgi:general secretion pathway protein L
MLAVIRHAENARATIATFFQWWGSELLDLVPAALRERLRHRPPAIVFQTDGNVTHALVDDRDGRRVIGRWTAGTEGARDWTADMISRVDRRSHRIGLRVPDGAGLYRSVTLPVAVLENLRQAISYDLDRLTPYHADDVVFDARVAARDTAMGTCTVELVVVPRTVLSHALETASQLGVDPEFVHAPTRGEPVDLLKHLDAFSARRRPWTTRALVALAFALGAAILAIPLALQAIEAGRVETVLETTKLQAEHVARLRKEIEGLESARSTLQARVRQTPDPLQILHALTALLPDDAFLTQWEVANGRVQITGYARSAVATLAAIEASPLFEETVFRAPVTQSGPDGREHFQIAANLSGARRP